MVERMGTVVVLGGSVSGMLAAAASARHTDRVILIERDELDGRIAPRKGVPQGRHNHNLFAGGRELVEKLLPGFSEAVRARGGHVVDSGLRCRWTIADQRIAPAASGHDCVLASRPCIDAAMLATLRALPNVEVLDRTDVLGLATEGARVTGARVAARASEAGERRIAADLVIDATGRGSRLPAWLEAMGQPAPPTEELEVRVAYATRTFRRRPGDLGGDVGVFLTGSAPDAPRGGVCFAIEGDRWTVLLYGYGEARPPLELDAFRAYAATLVDRDIAELVATAEPLDDGVAFTYPRAIRRRFDRVRGPRGVIAFGDALVSTNPCWGSGMTAAALQADALDRLLARGAPSPARWYAAALAACAPVWASTTENDKAYACVEGSPIGPVRALRRYLRAVCEGAREDAVLASAVVRVVERTAGPGTLLAPAVLGRVLTRALRPARVADGSRMLGA